MEGTARDQPTQGTDSTESLEDSQSPENQSDPLDSTSQTDSQPDGQGSDEKQADFNDPMLRGKSRQEIEETFQLLRQANSEQGQMLTRLQSQSQDQGPDGSVGRKKGDEYEEVDFFDDPDKKLDLFQRRMQSMITEAISPFKENLATQAADTARQQLRNRYDDFERFEPVIDTLLRQLGTDPQRAPMTQLEQLYFTAVGYAKKKGINVSGDGGQNVEQNQGYQSVSPPNRRPSSAPPASEEKKAKLRELTESERKLARQWGMSHEEYLSWQEKEQDEVVKPGFSFGEGR